MNNKKNIIDYIDWIIQKLILEKNKLEKFYNLSTELDNKNSDEILEVLKKNIKELDEFKLIWDYAKWVKILKILQGLFIILSLLMGVIIVKGGTDIFSKVVVQEKVVEKVIERKIILIWDTDIVKYSLYEKGKEDKIIDLPQWIEFKQLKDVLQEKRGTPLMVRIREVKWVPYQIDVSVDEIIDMNFNSLYNKGMQ